MGAKQNVALPSKIETGMPVLLATVIFCHVGIVVSTKRFAFHGSPQVHCKKTMSVSDAACINHTVLNRIGASVALVPFEENYNTVRVRMKGR
jgi:hypothetical protein